MKRAVGFWVLGGILLAGCNISAPMQVSKPVITNDQIAAIDAHADVAPIAFEKAIVALKRGTVIAHFPGPGQSDFDVSLCNNRYGNDTEYEWNSGSRLLGGWDDEISEIFSSAVGSKGYKVVGDPKKLFDAVNERKEAKFLIAAKITKIQGNICEEHHWWDGRPLGKFAAEFSQKIEWSVYSPLERRVVQTFVTEGFGRQNKATTEGAMNAFNDAFASAAEGLAADKSFYALLSDEVAAPEKESTASVDSKKSSEGLVIKGASLSKRHLDQWADKAVQGTVTIRASSGHGSGFVLSGDGYILTNYHVVGKAKNVSVVFANGLEVAGTVLRRNAKRDIALVRVSVRGLTAYGIRLGKDLRRLEEVYAIGSPLDEKLKSTITRGVVSAFREDERSKLPLIQSDVDISAGNSGGPLLDKNGNVVGVSVAGYGDSGLSAGLNLFIPIKSALSELKVGMTR